METLPTGFGKYRISSSKFPQQLSDFEAFSHTYFQVKDWIMCFECFENVTFSQ